MGVAPGCPGQTRAVGAQTREGVEVVAGDDDLARSAGVQVKADQRVDGLAAPRGVVLPNADYAAAPAVDVAIGVAQVDRRRKRLWLAAGVLAVEALVGEVREVDDAIGHRKSAATILARYRWKTPNITKTNRRPCAS